MTTINNTLGLYLHIPFCIRKCNYCDFLSFGGISDEDQKAYFRSLLREISYYSEIYGNKYYVDSIFIGGGTPSLTEESLVSELIRAVGSGFTVGANAEITIESNPKTLTKSKLDAYQEAGVNRLSIGAQSFHNGLLNSLGRVHTAGDFFTTYSMARECGFRNINIDLMFAIPGQTMELWMDTLTQAVGLAPEHISFYSLQLEEGTPFFSMFQEGSLKETDEELDRDMYHCAVEDLKGNGYLHYEISNAAKAGRQCRHNLKYWSMEDYLGLGIGAHSFLDGTRFSNETDLERYVKIGMQDAAGPGQKAYSPFTVWSHRNSREDSISEFLFTGMRKTEGVNLKEFAARFGRPVEEIFSSNWRRIQRFIEEEYLIHSEDNLRFTEKGIDISNTILTEFIL
ncbi:MAG TPA: radical SAM family heme chaperone HemW [Anaerovoracaceae bacterium]|nr:radical SAM family heme chaperone HemW [Anaerovoracaceae bacterium]